MITFPMDSVRRRDSDIISSILEASSGYTCTEGGRKPVFHVLPSLLLNMTSLMIHTFKHLGFYTLTFKINTIYKWER